MYRFPPLHVPIAAIEGHFGSKLRTFQAQVPPDQIVNILGHDPRSKNWNQLSPDLKQMYKYLQRPTSKNRREGVVGYIEERFSDTGYGIGAFPSISIGITQPAIFVQITEDHNNPLSVAGTLQLELSESNRRVLLDGLARVTGALDLLDLGSEFTNKFIFPITIYAPSEGALTLDQLGQLFHDFNFRQTKLPATLAIALDKSDPYIQLANTIGNSSTFEALGGMEERAASLGNKSTAIVVQRVLVRFVRGACEGRSFQEGSLNRVADPNLTMESSQDIQSKLEGFIGALVEQMGPDRFRDRNSLHLSAPGWQVLGVVFHDLEFILGERITEGMYEDILKRLATIDWSRYNPDWIGMIGEPERDKVTQKAVTDSDGRKRVALSRAGSTTIAAMLKYVREKCGLDELLAELETNTGHAVPSDSTPGESDGLTATGIRGAV